MNHDPRELESRILAQANADWEREAQLLAATAARYDVDDCILAAMTAGDRAAGSPALERLAGAMEMAAPPGRHDVFVSAITLASPTHRELAVEIGLAPDTFNRYLAGDRAIPAGVAGMVAIVLARRARLLRAAADALLATVPSPLHPPAVASPDAPASTRPTN